MASPTAIAIQCEESTNRIDARMKILIGEGLTPLPRTHRDREILRRDQLHTIADWLDRIPEAGDHEPDDRLIRALDLVASGNWTKAQMEAILLGDDDNG